MREMNKEEPDNTHRISVKCSISFNIYVRKLPKICCKWGSKTSWEVLRITPTWPWKLHWERHVKLKVSLYSQVLKRGGIVCPESHTKSLKA